MLTRDDCNSILRKVAFRYGVTPRLIYDRLFDDNDKKDLMAGNLSLEIVDINVAIWMKNKMPNCSIGCYKPYSKYKDFDCCN